jgi:methyltransferase-like protein
MMNDMMQFHCGDIDDPSELIDEARTFVDFLAEALPENSVHAGIVSHEQDSIASRSDENFFHDDLSPFNQPFYLHEFVTLLEQHGLSYIGEANPSTANPDRLRPDVRESIMGTSDDPVIREQYIDFVEMRRFRASIVCHADAEPLAEYDAGAFHFMRIASTLSPDGQMNLSPNATMHFSGKNGGLDVSHPLTKAFLIELERHGISGANCDEAIENTTMFLGSEPATEDLNILDTYLSMLFRAEFITAHSCDAKFIKTVSERPSVSAFARHQIESGSSFATTLAEANLNIDNPLVGAVLRLCDGTRTHEQIADELKEMVEVPEDERENFAMALPAMIEDMLREFAASGLMTA